MGTRKKNSGQNPSNISSCRDLKKTDLGGVVFGCTNHTMTECLSNQIFGLPNLHFSYIKNIEPGLPLFLFNYTDRKLHGIFEAASHGQMNINPYGWSLGGSEKTQYPAQVRIRIRLKCQPLLEQQFRPIISDNYYAAKHFWFELDHAQAGGLVSLFGSSPVIASTIIASPQDTLKWKPIPKSFPSHAKKHGTGNLLSNIPKDNLQSGPSLDASTSKDTNSDYDARNEDKGSNSSLSNVDFRSSQSSMCADDDNKSTEPQFDEVLEDEAQHVCNKLKQLSAEKECTKSSRNGQTVDIVPHARNDKPLEGDSVPKSAVIFSNKCQEVVDTPPDLQTQVHELKLAMEELKAFSLEQVLKITSLDKKLTKSESLVEELKGRLNQVESQLSSLATCVDKPVNNVHAINQSLTDLCDESHLGSNELIFLLGGYDGTSRLSSLDCYSPSKNVLKSLKPMDFPRSFAASATLNGDIYIFGGGDGILWYDTAESYNPLRNEWTARPSLSTQKGSLAGATLHNKIYALGGGNGVEPFSNVEMFDPALGRWIHTQSMLQKRFALAAAELNGVIYAVGGFDGKNYLSSAERYDPREVSWSRLESMNIRRGCHSLAVLNEKLYALGGNDGTRTVPSVEVLDPRMGSWMTGEEMKESRGYFTAVVSSGTLYAIGGIHQSNVFDTVEYYKEGQGWKLANFKAFGKRCFLSAVVL